MKHPKRLTVSGRITSLKVVPQNGQKQGEAILELMSGKRVKARMKATVLEGIMRMGKNIPSTIALDKIKGETPWIVGIRKTA